MAVFGVALFRKCDSHFENVGGLVGLVDSHERPEVPDHRPGCDQQHESKHDLRCGQNAAHAPRSEAAKQPAGARLERLAHVRPRTAQHPAEAEHEGCGDRDQQRGLEHHAIDANRVPACNPFRVVG